MGNFLRKFRRNGAGADATRNGDGPHEPPAEKPIRVLIAVPCRETVPSMFAYDLALLCAATLGNPDVETSLVFHRGTLIADQRQALAEVALADNATHILWLDSDMRFPPSLLIQFLARGLPIVAANYVTRRPPFKPTAMAHRDGRPIEIFTTPESKGLELVTLIGMGAMLTSTAVFRALPKPWFFITYDETVDGRSFYSGEDVFFCRHAGAANIPIVVDHDVSQDVRHIGDREYGHADVAQARIDAYRAPLIVPASA